MDAWNAEVFQCTLVYTNDFYLKPSVSFEIQFAEDIIKLRKNSPAMALLLA
jgi:hypothetical protein